MKILFLSQILPYPPDAGPRVKSWNVLRYLASKGHLVTLVSYVRPEEVKHIPRVKEVAYEVHTVPMRRSRISDLVFWLKSLISGRPFLVERDDLQSMRTLIKELIDSKEFNFIHADQLTMTQFAGQTRESTHKVRMSHRTDIARVSPHEITGEDNHRPGLIFDAHNAVWMIIQRMADSAPLFLKPFLRYEAQSVRNYEGAVVHNYDHIIAVSETDRQALHEAERVYVENTNSQPAENEKIHVLPIAVETNQVEIPLNTRSGNSILILGTLHYPPNADGVRWFLNDVFPFVRVSLPDVKLKIIGKNPPDDLVEASMQDQEKVNVTGYVANLEPHLRATDIMVVPVRVGGGMRVRILKGFAWGIPMVTTTVGLEGIEAIPGKHILVADDQAGFAKAIVDLLTSDSLRGHLRRNGLQLVKDKYDWKKVLEKLDEIYS